MDQTFLRGGTTRQEIVGIFGPWYRNLDRPLHRDGVVAIEYDLPGLGVQPGQNREETLSFEFDGKDRLLDYGFVYAICGFCPHVFADDGAWRLEGKLLAGCVGRGREGTDTLLLPRAAARQGKVRVQLANLAPEVEYIDAVALGCLSLAAGEELDADAAGRAFVWKPTRTILGPPGDGRVSLDGPRQGRVLVLEVRNTTAFEKAMRGHLLGGAAEPAGTALALRFDDGGARTIPPVGTKFLRRVVVPVPPRAGGVRLEAGNPLWLVRRLWVGSGRSAEAEVRWRAPGGEASLLRQRDGRRLRLDPMQRAVVTFDAPDAPGGAARRGYLLRMTGYYDFLP
jgi:hypothetical protein